MYSKTYFYHYLMMFTIYVIIMTFVLCDNNDILLVFMEDAVQLFHQGQRMQTKALDSIQNLVAHNLSKY